MKKIVLTCVFFAVSFGVIAQGEKGYYEVGDSAVITNDFVAKAQCSPEMLGIYKVEKKECLKAARKCLASMEANRIDLESNPMYGINCLLEEFGLELNDLNFPQ